MMIAVFGYEIKKRDREGLGSDRSSRELTPSLTAAQRLDFFRMEPGSAYRPAVCDYIPLTKVHPGELKFIIDPNEMDALVWVRWGGSPFAHNKARSVWELPARIENDRKWDIELVSELHSGGIRPRHTLMEVDCIRSLKKPRLSFESGDGARQSQRAQHIVSSESGIAEFREAMRRPQPVAINSFDLPDCSLSEFGDDFRPPQGPDVGRNNHQAFAEPSLETANSETVKLEPAPRFASLAGCSQGVVDLDSD